MEFKSESEMLTLAEGYAKAGLPDWVTHIAVQKYDNRIEPAAWDERVQRVIGEDPATIPLSGMATVFKRAYWKIFPVEQVLHGAALVD